MTTYKYKYKEYPSVYALCKELNLKYTTTWRRLKSGWSVEEAVEGSNVNRRKVANRSKKSNKLTPYLVQILLELREQGLTYTEIADKLNISASSVGNVVKHRSWH